MLIVSVNRADSMKKHHAKILTGYTMPITSEIIIIEFHQSKRDWLTLGKQNFCMLPFYYPRYESKIIISDFSVSVEPHR